MSDPPSETEAILAQCAGALSRDGFDESVLEAGLQAMNREQQPPLSEAEVTEIVRSAMAVELKETEAEAQAESLREWADEGGA